MIDSVIRKFVLYCSNYDLEDPEILDKYKHCFRVMEYSKEIAESLNLSEKNVTLATIIGLLHDIGRFEQYSKYKTWETSRSIDHGDLGYDILKSGFIDEIEEKDIILKAVKNHNKLKIEEGLDYRTLLFCNIIRDADKLDIMKTQCLSLTEKTDSLNPKSMYCFYTNTLFDDKNIEQESDYIFRLLSFIYDLNFKYSYSFVLENKIIESKIDLLKQFSSETHKLDIIEKNLFGYIEHKLKNIRRLRKYKKNGYFLYNDDYKILTFVSISNGNVFVTIPGLVSDFFFDEKIDKKIKNPLINPEDLFSLGSYVFHRNIFESENRKLKKQVLEINMNYYSCYRKFSAEDYALIVELCNDNNMLPYFFTIDELKNMIMNKGVNIDRTMYEPLEELQKRLNFEKY